MAVKAVVVGGGSWGTAFSCLLRDRGHEVTLACRDPEQAREIAATGRNPRYLSTADLTGVTAMTVDAAPVAEADVVDQLGRYDGVLYDPYPTAAEGERAPGTTSNLDDPFYAVAASVLRPDGIFSHFTDEIDSLSRPHQRFLLRYFERVEVEIVHGLAPPPGCHYFSADSMAVVSATRPRAVG